MAQSFIKSQLITVFLFLSFQHATYSSNYESETSEYITTKTEQITKNTLFLKIIVAAQNPAGETLFDLEINLNSDNKKHIKFNQINYTIAPGGGCEILIPSDIINTIKGLATSSKNHIDQELSHWEYYRYTEQDDSGILWILERRSRGSESKYIIIQNLINN